MRTREKGYADYDFLPGEEREIKERCRKTDFKTYTMVHLATHKANPAIAEALAFSLIYGLSFEKIDNIHAIPYAKREFYGYRRKALAYFRDLSSWTNNTVDD